MSKHTRTPWRIFTTTDGRKLVGIGAKNGQGILDCGFGVWAWDDAEGIANARLVVTAVNAFDDMKAALIACQSALAMMTSPASISVSSVQHAWVTATAAEAKARAALSKAEGHIGQELAPDPERRVSDAQSVSKGGGQ